MISFTAEQRFIVTGASSGIGEGVALLLNELGATVIGIGRNVGRLEAMKAKAKAPERVFLEVKELTEDIAGLPAYVKSLKDKHGKFRGMALCAGISNVMPVQMMTYEAVHQMFDINYFAPLFMAKAFGDRRINAGAGSALVAISSIGGIVAERGQCMYAGAKAGLAATFKSIAREFTAQHVRVNCVSPAMVETPMAIDTTSDYHAQQRAKYPFGYAEVSDVANMVAYLLSDDAKWITGQNYIIDCASY